MRYLAIALTFVALGACTKSSTDSSPSPSAGASFTLTGTVESTNAGDKPDGTLPKGVSGLAGSIKVKKTSASGLPSSCPQGDTVTVFWTSKSDLAVQTTGMTGKNVDIAGSAFTGCVLVADSVSLHVGTTSGGTSGTSAPGSSGSPGPLASPHPSATKGPAPEGAIYDETPSVPPATQK